TIGDGVTNILPIQGPAVPCEHVFSSAKETMTPCRNKVKPQLMEVLQLLKFLLWKGLASLDFTSGLSKEKELSVLQDESFEDGLIPDDILPTLPCLLHH
ncbi:hypothetical protein FA15DRAFT_603843, partial [Coprinopsis marcescibilis]